MTEEEGALRLEEKRSYRLNVESWEKDGFLREDTDLDLSGGELLHAVVTAMIPEEEIFFETPGEGLSHRLRLLEYALEARGEYLRKAPGLLSLDESVRGAVSYCLGMIAARLVGARLYGTRLLAPVQSVCGNIRYKGYRRADLIGYGEGGLQVWQAVGRSNNSGKALAEGSRLAGELKSFGDESPALSCACMTYYGSRCLSVRVREAESGGKVGFSLPQGREDAERAYYGRLAGLLNACYERESLENRLLLGEDMVEARIRVYGGRRLAVAMPRRLFFAVREGGELPEIKAVPGPLADGTYRGADGVCVRLLQE